MGKIALILNETDCMGCHACEVACKQEHGLGIGPRLIRVIEEGPYFKPMYCHHCDDAPCATACPVNAITQDVETGIVLVNNEECTGCEACIEVCPYGVMQFNYETKKAVKCDMCAEKRSRGEAPACYSVCPTRCIFWGDPEKYAESGKVL